MDDDAPAAPGTRLQTVDEQSPEALPDETAREFLQRVWEVKAINTLGTLLQYRGRQAMVAQAAARTILEYSSALSESRVDKLVEGKFKELVEEARRRIEARNAGASLEKVK